MRTINPKTPVMRSLAEYRRYRAAHPTGPVLIEFGLQGGAPAAPPRRRVTTPAAPPAPDDLADLEREVDALEARVRARGRPALPPGWEPKRSAR